MTHYRSAAELRSTQADGYEQSGDTFFHKLPADLITDVYASEARIFCMVTPNILSAAWIIPLLHTGAPGSVMRNANAICTARWEANPQVILIHWLLSA